MIVKLLQWNSVSKTVQQIIDLGGIIAGGYARYLAAPYSKDVKSFKDIDIFVPCDKPEVYTAIADLLLKQNPDRVLTLKNSMRYEVIDDKFDAIIYNLVNISHEPFWIISSLLGRFDLDVCQVGLDKSGLYGTNAFVTSYRSNYARFAPNYVITDPMLEMKRLFKYAEKGFTITNTEIAKCMDAWALLSQAERISSLEHVDYAM